MSSQHTDTIMVVDDDQYLLSAIGQTLHLSGYPADLQQSPVNALELIKQKEYLAVIADIRMPVMNGMQLLAGIKSVDADLPVIMITGHGDISLAVQAIKAGAYDFLEKPVDEEDLLTSLRRAVEKRRLVMDNRRLQEELSNQGRKAFFRGMVGCHPLMHDLYDIVETIANESDPVLLTGETGTGKELVARAIHGIAAPSGPFVGVNMAALPPEIVESELFGHERGAFTGAHSKQIGKFEYAGNGTLFLDEICSLPFAQQGKLLRAIEDKSFSRLGGHALIPLEARIISATNKTLDEEIAAGRFRQDLFYRLNVLTIDIPPLRKRKEDIPLLAEYFRQEYCQERQTEIPPLAKEHLAKICQSDWPGNIRELRNYIRRCCIFGGEPGGSDTSINEVDKPINGPSRPTLQHLLNQHEEKYILSILEECKGKVGEAHRILGLSRKALYDKVKKYEIDLSAYRSNKQSPGRSE